MPLPIPPAELPVDARLARRLLRAQHPDLADLPLRRIGTGWDTTVFRLGRELTVRLPRRELGARLVAHELRWLPELAMRLPLVVPEPLRAGQPSGEYPWSWSVCRFVPGAAVGAAGLRGEQPARQVGAFLQALHVPAPDEAPQNPYRGVPLRLRDASVRAAIKQVPAADRAELRALWSRAIDAPEHQGRPLWLHGDLHGLNLLQSRGRISGVIDFGDVCAGDPATDLACAWMVLDAAGRSALQAHVAAPDDRWARGWGWAVFFTIMFWAHSRDAPENAAIARRTLGALRDDRL